MILLKSSPLLLAQKSHHDDSGPDQAVPEDLLHRDVDYGHVCHNICVIICEYLCQPQYFYDIVYYKKCVDIK